MHLMNVGTISPYLFKQPSGIEKHGQLLDSEQDESEKKDPFEEKNILCGFCNHAVTSVSEIIDINHSHKHTFANPHGIVFEIGCFRSARGCVQSGPESSDWSWFTDFTWQIAICKKCRTHLGWYFSSTKGKDFFGLILNRLTQYSRLDGPTGCI